MAVSIVATPYLLRWLGDERMGAYAASADWAGYIGLLELGLGGALPPMFAAALSRRDDAQTRQVMGVGLAAYRWVACFMLLAGALLVVIIPYVVKVSPALVFDLRMGAVIACISIMFTPLSPLRPFLEGGQRSYIVNGAILAQSLTISFLSLLFAWKGFGISGQWLAIVGGAALYTSIILFFAWRHLPGLPSLILQMRTAAITPPTMPADALSPVDAVIAPPIENGALNAKAQLWRLNGPTLIFNTCGRVSYLTDRMLIALFLGSAAVMPFKLTQALALIIQGQVQNIGNATWAALAELHTTGQRELFIHRTVQLTQIVFVTSLAGMLPFVAFNKSFILRWVGANQYAGPHVVLLAGANGIFLSLISFWLWPFTATQSVRLIVPPVLTAGLINIVGSVIGTKFLGKTGPLWGTFISFPTIYLWWIPLLMRKTFGVPCRELIGCLVKPSILAAIYGVPIIWLGHAFPLHMWVTIGGAMAMGGCGYLGLAAIFVLDAEQRQTLSNRFLRRFIPASRIKTA